MSAVKPWDPTGREDRKVAEPYRRGWCPNCDVPLASGGVCPDCERRPKR